MPTMRWSRAVFSILDVPVIAVMSFFMSCYAMEGELHVQPSTCEKSTHTEHCALNTLSQWLAYVGLLDGKKSIIVPSEFLSVSKKTYHVLLTDKEDGSWYTPETDISEDKSARRSINLPRSVSDGALATIDQHAWYSNGRVTQDSASWYVQKKHIGVDDSVFIFGDLHGDIHALLHALLQLKEDVCIDDAFTLHPQVHLVFLGDYVDRGDCGLEVLFLLLTLKNKNPDQVVLLRGNHEAPLMNHMFGFRAELAAKMPQAVLAECVNSIYSLFNALPVALYLGFEESEKQQWVLCCHGGPEIGFCPHEFLQSEALFCAVYLNRDFYIKLLPADVRRTLLNISPISLTAYAGQKAQDSDDALDKDSEAWVAPLGFLWNDCVVQGDNVFQVVKWRGCVLGERLVDVLLKRDGIQFVVRGHQHNGELLTALYKEGGSVSLYNGRVHTLISGNVVPDAKQLLYSFLSFSRPEYGDGTTPEWELKRQFAKRLCCATRDMQRARRVVP